MHNHENNNLFNICDFTSLTLFPKGQYFNNPSTSIIASYESLLKNNMLHLRSCSWYIWQVCTLCSGIITCLKKIMCSSRRGTANPDIMLIKIKMRYILEIYFLFLFAFYYFLPGQNIEEFSWTIKFEIFMNQCLEAISDSFSDHFTSWYQLFM